MRGPIVLLAALGLAGCAMDESSAPASEPAAPAEEETSTMLAGTHWQIETVNGEAVQLDRPTDIEFTADRIQGRAGCNSFGGGYQVTDGVLTTRQVISTKMACAGGGMDVENAFFKIIAGPTTLQQQGHRLVMSSDAGTVTLTQALRP